MKRSGNPTVDKNKKDRQEAVSTISQFRDELVRAGHLSVRATLSPRGALEWLKDSRIYVWPDQRQRIRKAAELLS